jgi:hypothetical protein
MLKDAAEDRSCDSIIERTGRICLQCAGGKYLCMMTTAGGFAKIHLTIRRNDDRIWVI